MSDELQRVTSLSDWYVQEQLDFDKRLIRFRYQSIKAELVGPRGLELGPAEGEMTQFLIDDFEQLTVVDGASSLLAKIPMRENLEKVHSLFEEFVPTVQFNSIIMEHILEHVDEPVLLLERVKQWLAPGGKIFVGVPNGNSIHRLVAVKMGLLEDKCQLNSRDIALGHRRVYTTNSFSSDIKKAAC